MSNFAKMSLWSWSIMIYRLPKLGHIRAIFVIVISRYFVIKSHISTLYPDQYTLLTKHHIRQILAIHQITTVTHSFLTKHGYYAIDQSNTRVFPRDIACAIRSESFISACAGVDSIFLGLQACTGVGVWYTNSN